MARAPSHRSPVPVPRQLPRGKRRPVGLAGLRGFESAARHLSFTLAAEELHLTQSAISRQIASVERELGSRLFQRRTRSLTLTQAGEQLYRAVRDGILGIDRVVDRIRGVATVPRVSVTTYQSFASLWLVPHLAAFQRDHPELEIRIDASDHLVDLEREGIDIALRRIQPERAPSEWTFLLDEDVTPVLTSDLQKRFGPDGIVPQDLLRMPLIDIDSRMPNDPNSWESWFALAGVDPGQRGKAGMLFVGYSDQSIHAAARGQGVALAQSPFYSDMVCAGQLVAPFTSKRLLTGYRIFLVENSRTRNRPEVKLLRDWLLGQFRTAEHSDT